MWRWPPGWRSTAVFGEDFARKHISALSCAWAAFLAWGVAAKPLGHTRNVVPCTLNSLLGSPRGLRACTAVFRGPPQSGTGVTQCRAFFGYGSSGSGWFRCLSAVRGLLMHNGRGVRSHTRAASQSVRGVSQPPATSVCGWGCSCVQCCCSGVVSESAALHVLHKVPLPLRLCNDASSACCPGSCRRVCYVLIEVCGPCLSKPRLELFHIG